MNNPLLETKTSIEPPSALSMRLWLMLMIFNAVALGVNLAFSVRLTNGVCICNHGAWTDFLEFSYNHYFAVLLLLGATFFAATWFTFRVVRCDGRRGKVTLAWLPIPFVTLLFWLITFGERCPCPSTIIG